MKIIWHHVTIQSGNCHECDKKYVYLDLDWELEWSSRLFMINNPWLPVIRQIRLTIPLQKTFIFIHQTMQKRSPVSKNNQHAKQFHGKIMWLIKFSYRIIANSPIQFQVGLHTYIFKERERVIRFRIMLNFSWYGQRRAIMPVAMVYWM